VYRPFLRSELSKTWARLSLPRPPTVDFQDQRPAKKGADQYEASEQTETDEGQFMCDGFHDIGGRNFPLPSIGS
jgi:hypothetical protein